ncbi:nucleoside-diphosphate-sugar epimerase [Candidatus Magnetomorum sp. HK-1]|nr:nucleoside-diphosphate-sugar epimerase [Candidatus Magnetomorum sp. HK-1]
MKQNILITGGAGFIGSHIAEKTLENNYNVRIFDNLSTGKLSNLDTIKDHIEFIKGDIRDYDHLKKSFQGCDIIFHEAAEVFVPRTVKDPIETSMINDIGTLNVFEAARQCGVQRVVFASSCAIYGDAPQLPKVETMLPRPKSPYAAQKIMGEYYAKLYNDLYQLETVCLRYFNVYGPRQDPSSPYSGVISIFLTKAINNEQPIIYGDGNQNRDFVNVKDVVQANMLAATQTGANGNVYNVGTGKTVSINALWENVCKLTGISLSPTYEPFRSGDILASVSDIRHAIQKLSYSPSISFEEGLKETLEWYQCK